MTSENISLSLGNQCAFFTVLCYFFDKTISWFIEKGWKDSSMNKTCSIFISILVRMYEFHTSPENPEYCRQKQQRMYWLLLAADFYYRQTWRSQLVWMGLSLPSQPGALCFKVVSSGWYSTQMLHSATLNTIQHARKGGKMKAWSCKMSWASSSSAMIHR